MFCLRATAAGTIRPREFPHRLTRVIMTSYYTASYTYSLPKGWRIGCPGGRDHPRDGLTPERPGESNLLGTRVLGLILVVFARVAGSLLGPRRHLACSEGNRGAGDGSKPLRGRSP